MKNSVLGSKVQRYPAHSFKDDLKAFVKPSSVYWIATQPKLQFELLKELASHRVDILIDKPIVTNLEELDELRELAVESKSNITVAQPWRHSDLWQSSKLSTSDIRQIVINRTFNEERNYISPTLDWLPHDYSLLIDLGIESTSLKYKSFVCEERTGCNLLAKSAGEISLSISLRRSLKRGSTWKIVLKNGTTRIINFHTRTSSMIDSYGTTLEDWTQPANDHPIEAVINNFRILGKSDLFSHANYYESFFRLGGK